VKEKRISDDDVIWICQYCGKENDVWVDFTIGNKQDFYEDCSFCCRPNRIIINIDEDENIFAEARLIDE
jgi:hypothetical protein